MNKLYVTISFIAIFLAGVLFNAKADKRSELDFIKIGETTYDLQSNSSMGNRLNVYDDGTMSAVWTLSLTESPAFSDRGTGYNHFDGNEWTSYFDIEERLETDRTGWPSINIYDGYEIVVSHYAGAEDFGTGGMNMQKNSQVGERDFDERAILTSTDSVDDQGPIWPRTAIGDEYLHIIGTFSGTDLDEEEFATISGLNLPMVYSKYNIEEDTFYYEGIPLPGMDTLNFLNSGPGGDSYSIDAKDNTVSIVANGFGTHIFLWKSEDYGETWEKTVVDSFPGAPFDFENHVADMIEMSDNSLHVMLDDDLNSHVFWGKRGSRWDTQDGEGYFMERRITGIEYWNEVEQEKRTIAQPIDRNEDGEITFEGFVNSQLFGSFSYGGTGLTSIPTAGIDDDGNMYMVYMSVLEEGFHIFNDAYYSDIYIVYSTDGGATWSDPQNITDDWENEQTFPAMAKTVDDHVHLIFQDQGINIGSAVNADDAADIPVEMRDIYYVAVDVEMILNDELGQGTTLEGTNIAGDISNSGNFASAYPNPFNDNITVEVDLNQSADTHISIYNTMGQQVVDVNENMGSFNNSVEIPAGHLQNGIYFLKINTGENSETIRMIKE